MIRRYLRRRQEGLLRDSPHVHQSDLVLYEILVALQQIISVHFRHGTRSSLLGRGVALLRAPLRAHRALLRAPLRVAGVSERLHRHEAGIGVRETVVMEIVGLV